jgi:hypothetical protein
MKVSYNFSVDAAYFRNVVDRYFRQRPFFLRLPVQFGIAGLLTSGFLIFTTNASNGAEAVVPLLIGAVVFVTGVLVTRAGILFRLKSKAEFGQEIVVVISDGGVEANGRYIQGTWQWAAYPKSVRFPDGILLMRAGTIRWLPDSAIKGGTADEATTLVASKTVLRRIA